KLPVLTDEEADWLAEPVIAGSKLEPRNGFEWACWTLLITFNGEIAPDRDLIHEMARNEVLRGSLDTTPGIVLKWSEVEPEPEAEELVDLMRERTPQSIEGVAALLGYLISSGEHDQKVLERALAGAQALSGTPPRQADGDLLLPSRIN
ncbi:MAG: hypothetical protein AAGC81_12090, partial [Pseudomonadota bacterium]